MKIIDSNFKLESETVSAVSSSITAAIELSANGISVVSEAACVVDQSDL